MLFRSRAPPIALSPVRVSSVSCYALQGCRSSAGSCGKNNIISETEATPVPADYRADPCQVPGSPCKNLHASPGRGVARAVIGRGRRNPCRNVAVTISAAPAQNVSGMFTAPSVNDLGRHLKLVTMLAPIFDQRPKVIDEFSGSVVSDVRGAGERFVVYRPA